MGSDWKERKRESCCCLAVMKKSPCFGLVGVLLRCVVFDEREREIMGFELQLGSLETAIL